MSITLCRFCASGRGRRVEAKKWSHHDLSEDNDAEVYRGKRRDKPYKVEPRRPPSPPLARRAGKGGLASGLDSFAGDRLTPAHICDTDLDAGFSDSLEIGPLCLGVGY